MRAPNVKWFMDSPGHEVTQCYLHSGKYRNDGSHHMHTVPTWDHREPSEFREAAREEFKRYGSVKVEDAEVASVGNNRRRSFPGYRNRGTNMDWP